MAFLNVTTAPLYVCLFIMFLGYLWAVRKNFYSIVDVIWSYSFTITAFIYASRPTENQWRNMILLAVVSLWSTRLGTHLLLRLRAHYPKEDGRYDALKLKWANNLKLNFFIFFIFQGFSVVLLSLPFLLIAMNPSRQFHWLEYLGLGVWITGLLGEAIADNQLKHFKSDPQNKGQVCQRGLWNYSRHPNYFFEWLTWVGYSLAALAAPLGWMGLMSPLIMFYLLNKMTGIPYTEEQSIKSRGDLYREYQRTTSQFFPWFKKK